MEIKNTPYTLRKLEAAPGHQLISREDLGSDAPNASRAVYLGAGDSVDNYVEVTDEYIRQKEEDRTARLAAEAGA